MKHFSALLLCLLTAAPALRAQPVLTQTVRGTVVDRESQLPMHAALVVVMSVDSRPYAVADEQGRFRINNVPVGQHTIRITFMGYEPVVLTNVHVNSGKETVLQVEMKQSVEDLDAVVVEAEEGGQDAANEMATVSARSFSMEEAQRFAGALGDPSRMAANFAGVSGANDSRNDIIVRGNSPNGVLWRLEGIDIPNPNHFSAQGSTGGPVSILNNNLLRNSDFFTGAWPAEYGNSFSGVFDLRLRNGNNEQREHTAQIGFNGFELMSEGPINKAQGSSYLASYRYSVLGFFQAIGLNLGPSGTPRYQDLSFKLNLPTKKAGHFEVFGIGGISYIELLDRNRTEEHFTYGQARRDVYYGSRMGIVGASNTVFLKGNAYWKTIVAVSTEQVSADVDSLYRTFRANGDSIWQPAPFYYERADFHRITLHSFINRKVDARNSFRTGIIAKQIFYDNRSRFFNTGGQHWEDLLDAQGNSQLLQAYGNLKHNFNSRFSTVVGVNGQFFALNNTWTVEPRLGLRYKLGDRLALNGGYGLHSMAVPLNLVQRRLYNPSDGTYTEPHRQLGFVQSHHSVVGYDYLFAKDFRLKMETYYQWLYNVPVSLGRPTYSFLNTGADFVNPMYADLVNEGTGRNYGLEMTLEKFFSRRYFFLLTGSLFQSQYQGYDRVWRNTAFNSNIVANALAGKDIPVGNNNVDC